MKGIERIKLGKAVHSQSGESVRLSEDQAAAADILPHDGFPILPGIFDSPPPERLVKTVVCVAGQQPDPYFAPAAEHAGTQIPAAFRNGIDQFSVFGSIRTLQDFLSVDPWMTASNPLRTFF